GCVFRDSLRLTRTSLRMSAVSFILPNECGALTRFAGHTTQGSKRIPIHLLPSKQLQRHRGRQAGQDSAAEIRPLMARRLPWLQASSLTESKGTATEAVP